jgi:preprotein translocase subunit SecF
MQIIKNRKWFYIFSSTIIIIGIVSIFVQGFNLGIDFKGGSLLRYKITSSISAEQVRTSLNDLKMLTDINVQKSGSDFFIRTNELDQKQTAEVTSTLTTKFKTVEMQSAESVGSVVGGEVTRNAFIAVFIALAFMMIYITFRFEWTFGLAAVLAVFHDVLMVVGIFSIFQWEINSAFIAAILTIIGYSLMDTIVIFDRVRENLRMKKKDTLDMLLDKSILQTLNRSVNTVLAVLMPLFTLVIFGGSSIKGFVVALLIGFCFGMYSSICIASPIYYEIKQRG